MRMGWVVMRANVLGVRIVVVGVGMMGSKWLLKLGISIGISLLIVVD